jgi:hypothetical protein
MHQSLPCFWLPLGLNPGTRFQSPPQAQTWGVRPPSRRRMAFSTSEQIRTTKPPTTPQQTHGPPTGPCSMQGHSRATLHSTSTRPPSNGGPLEGEAMGLAASKALARGTAKLLWTLQHARATRSAQPPLDPVQWGHSKARLYITPGMSYFSTADLWHLRWSRRQLYSTSLRHRRSSVESSYSDSLDVAVAPRGGASSRCSASFFCFCSSSKSNLVESASSK